MCMVDRATRVMELDKIAETFVVLQNGIYCIIYQKKTVIFGGQNGMNRPSLMWRSPRLVVDQVAELGRIHHVETTV